MALTIRTKLFLLSSLGLALVVALGVASDRGTARMGEAMAEIRTTGSALRNHLEGDMMHDALRSDVLASLLASPEEQPQVRSDLAQHAAHFREMLGENEALALPPAVRAALDAYIAHAERIVARAAEDRDAARAEYSDFLESFETLEARMAELSDLVEQSADDARQHGQDTQTAARRTALVVCLFAVVALGAGALLVTRAIVAPLGRTVAVLEQVAGGDLTPRLAIGSRDEIARMAQSLNRTLDAVGGLMARIDESSRQLTAASEELGEVSERLRESASATSQQSSAASASAEEIRATVESVAKSTEEMTVSIEEIARNAAEAASMSSRGVEAAGSTDAVMRGLAASSTEIGEAIRSIRSIAEQTDALAASAGSQAAKVGEAGAGFAIVAQEVKSLARETSRATDEIGRRLDAIRSSSTDAAASVAEIGGVVKMINGLAAQTNLLALNATIEAGRAATAGAGVGQMAREVKSLAEAAGGATHGVSQRAVEIQRECKGAVDAVAQITEVVRRVSDLQSAIAGAVEEQSATTQEIARSVAAVATGSGDIAVNVGEVAKAANDTAEGADRTREAAERLHVTAGELAQLVSRFRFARAPEAG